MARPPTTIPSVPAETVPPLLTPPAKFDMVTVALGPIARPATMMPSAEAETLPLLLMPAANVEMVTDPFLNA
jgi:hypothetical protein